MPGPYEKIEQIKQGLSKTGKPAGGNSKNKKENRDERLLVLLFLGALILGTDRLVPNPALLTGAYYLTAPIGKNSPEILRVDGSEAGQEVHSALTLITPDLSCAETPPEFALFFNLPIPVNRAAQDSLDMLPGIGPKLAAKIIAFRQEQGDINGPKDLIRIKGIGQKMTERLRPLLCFVGTEQEQ